MKGTTSARHLLVDRLRHLVIVAAVTLEVVVTL